MTQTRGEGIGHSVAVCPINVRSPDIAIFDDEGNEKTDLAEVLSSNDILDTNHASINVAHSNDVMVGPSTQFYGPVTINHNVYGPLNRPDNSNQNTTTPTIQTPPSTPPQQQQQQQPQQRPESTFSSKAPVINDKTGTKFENKYKILRSKYLLYVVVFTVIIFICLGITYLIVSLQKFHQDNASSSLVIDILTPAPPTTVTNDISDTSKPPRFQLIDREKWGAAPPLGEIPPLRHPIPNVIIKHTVTRFGKTFEDCSKLVKNLQTFFLQKNSLDIDYNFLICGDDNVYVGRGWNYENDFRKNTILLTFIGDFTTGHDNLSIGMEKVALELLNEGLKNKTLAENYAIVAHKQLAKTVSPGENVDRVIKKWPHFNGKITRVQ